MKIDEYQLGVLFEPVSHTLCTLSRDSRQRTQGQDYPGGFATTAAVFVTLRHAV